MENTNLSKTYNPKDFEARLYKKWMKGILNLNQIQIKNHLQ